MPKAASLHDALVAGSLQSAFETLFGITVANQDPVTNTGYRELLFSLVSDPQYSEIVFTTALPAAASLHDALDTDPAYRPAFAAIYGIDVASQDPVANPDYRNTLFGIVSTPGYDEAACCH